VQQVADDQADRPRQVQAVADRVDDRAGVAHVGVRDADARVALREQRLEVTDHDRVVVDVGHPRGRVDAQHRFVGVRDGRQPAAQVGELADARLRRPDRRPGQELAILDGHLPDQRDDAEQPVRHVPVRRVIVLAAEDIVIHARDTRLSRVKIGHARHPKAGPTRSPYPVRASRCPR